MLKTWVLLTIILLLLSNQIHASQINDKFREEEIFPDVLDEKTDEIIFLSIDYQTSGVQVNLGNELDPSQISYAPDIRWDSDDDAFYTLLMTEVLDDLAVDLNLLTVTYSSSEVIVDLGNVLRPSKSGRVIFDYLSSMPQIETGFHRYVFLLFKQSSSSIVYSNSEKLERNNTNTRKLISEYNLTLVAGNFFQAQFEGALGFINDKFRDAEIVPDIFDEFIFTVELKSLNVTYSPSGVTVDLGNLLRPSQVSEEPVVKWDGEDGAFYTLLMTDADAAETTLTREYRHWLTVNINENDLKSGDVIFDYVGSEPPVDTGVHRYVFLLFKQPSSKMEYPIRNETLHRMNTSTRTLINEFNLTLVAGNFFKAQFEEVSGVINDKFREAEILPDILDVITVELKPLSITYPASGVRIDLGNMLSPSQVNYPPEVRWEAEAGAFYTLLMTDPDAPSRVNLTAREYRHWLAANINENNLNSGEVILEYFAPVPLEGTGLHRYVFLLFKQTNGSLKYDKTLERVGTSTRNLITDFKLTLVAGDFFEAQYEITAGTEPLNTLITCC